MLAVKVMYADDYGYTSDIVQGVNYAIAQGADIINMSIGGPGYDAAMDAAVTNAKNNGIVVVCAAGNDGTDAPAWPSDAEDAISVINLNQSDVRFSSSNYGEAKDIAAPGYYILSTYNGGGYGYMTGTSMASPVVAGVAALLLDKDNTLTVDQVTQILYTTADDLGDPGKDIYYGYGRVNAAQAVTHVYDNSSEGDPYPILSGQMIASQINPVDDTDWYSFTAESSDTAQVVVEGLDSQSLTVEILNDVLTPLVSTTPGVSQSYDFIPSAGSTYYVTVAGYDSSIGEYSVIIYQDTIADSAVSADTLTSGQRVSSYIETSTDSDVFLFTAEAGALVTFSVSIPDGTKSAVLQIDDSSGTVYAGNAFYDDESYSLHVGAEETFTVTLSSTDEKVPYTLTVNSQFGNASIISEGDKLSGSLEQSGDEDNFAFTPTATQSYYINTLGNTDTVLTLYDYDGTFLAESDDIAFDFGVENNRTTSGIYYEMTQGETYYFAVSGYDGTITGDYGVSVTTENPETVISIPDAHLQAFLEEAFGLTDASDVMMCIMLIVEDVTVEGLTDSTGITQAKNLETLSLMNSPAITDLNAMGGLPHLSDAVFDGTQVTAFRTQ